MNPAYEEIEVKLYVPDLDAMARLLDAVGAQVTAPRVFERNVRYENAEKSLTVSGIVLRLRQDTRVRLTYKGPPSVPAGDHEFSRRFEAEVEVSDFHTMEVILGHLGYFPYLIYEKYRTTYSLAGAEIALDELPYGNFMEIEGEVPAIQSALDRLGLQAAARVRLNYIQLFERVRQALNLDFRDLTFDNFRGISTPPGMLFQE